MALNSTPRRRFGVALGVVFSTVAAGLIGFAGTASAHNKDVSVECKDDKAVLTVNLTYYNKDKTNTVTVKEGENVLVDAEEFDVDFRYTKDFSVDVKHDFFVEVKAGDDPESKEGWSFTRTLDSARCVTETTTTTTTTTETTTSTTETTETTETTTSESSEVPSSSSETPVPSTTVVPTTTTTAEVDEAALAETGASIGLPLGIAGVLIVGGAVALFVVRRRSKA